jgi:hypothetical protein
MDYANPAHSAQVLLRTVRCSLLCGWNQCSTRAFALRKPQGRLVQGQIQGCGPVTAHIAGRKLH